MKSKEEKLEYNRAWWAAYRKTETYKEKLALKRERDRRYRERMTQKRREEKAAAAKKWRLENATRITEYVREHGEQRAEWKREARTELPDWYIKEHLRLSNPPQELIEAKRLHKRIKKLIEDTR